MSEDSESATRSSRSPGHVEYDRIARTYDRRYAHSPMHGVASALRSRARALEAVDLLEVGCGTARYLADLPPGAARRCGLDLSTGMLEQARQRGADLQLLQARAGQIPFADGVFDLVFCVNAIHHFDHPGVFVREAYRSLRPGGVLAVIGSDPHDGQGAWYIYDYFEDTLQTDLRRFPSWGRIVDWMVTADFGGIEFHWVERIHDPKIGREVLDDPFLRKDACSQLALLSDEDYAAGLGRIKSAVEDAAAAGEDLVFLTDIRIGSILGRRSSRPSEARM